MDGQVIEIDANRAMKMVVAKHYLHRRCNAWRCFGLFTKEMDMVGVCIFGIPASHHLRKGVCPSDPSIVIELSRLWLDDDQPRNSESWFIRKSLSMLPPRIIISYADTSAGHQGYVYRAAGFKYAGWTDMDRQTPRFDYVPEGRSVATLFGEERTVPHSRDAFRGGARAVGVTTTRRKPKVRYWEVTGNRRERRDLVRLCAWPSISWKNQPPPGEIV